MKLSRWQETPIAPLPSTAQVPAVTAALVASHRFILVINKLFYVYEGLPACRYMYLAHVCCLQRPEVIGSL